MSYSYKSKTLERLGVRSWINANNWSTVLGGTWIPEKVVEAMDEVSKTFVDMYELIAKVDEGIAKLCHVDDAHIAPGAGAAIELSVAGCIAGNDFGKWLKLPNVEGMKNEIAMPRGHYISYTPQWGAAGGKIIEYGQSGSLRSFNDELISVINEKTCCLSYTISYNVVPRGVIPLEEVIDVGRKHNIPLVVDAASMLPPVSNLHKFTDMGVDIVCFSGGKAIQAPNNTGIMLGKGKGAEIIASIRDHSFPHDGWGRGHKISKEQIVGLYVALEEFVKNGDSYYAKQMKVANSLVKELREIKNLNVSIIPNDDTLHEHNFMPHVPRVKMEWDKKIMGFSSSDLDKYMEEKDPPITLRRGIYYDYFTNKEWRLIDTYYLRDEEVKILVNRLIEFFTSKGK
jgi:L-seryl-tRNA(Ser) seleniumtransferase